MKIIRTVAEMQKIADELRSAGKQIGFVPTMGYLHEGHLSLVDLARKNTDVVVVSIFVNPTQFGPNEDLDKYPRNFEMDEQNLNSRGVAYIYYPTADSMYPKNYRSYISVEDITTTLCGESRPGHFRGVATVVGKLFNIVKPHVAVFGSKDFQQLQVIKSMVRDLNFDIEIVGGEIIREADGLAMSSRNKYLSPDERKSALILNQSLQKAKQLFENGTNDTAEIIQQISDDIGNTRHCKIDYIKIVDADTFKNVEKLNGGELLAMAVFVGKTRLIDNTCF